MSQQQRQQSNNISVTANTVPTSNLPNMMIPQQIPSTDPRYTSASNPPATSYLTSSHASASPNQNHLNNNLTFTVTDLINLTTSTKCSFPIYTGKQNVYEWKISCILELATSTKPIHQTIIEYDTYGNPQFKSTLAREESQELFRLTKNAISNKLNTTFLTVDILQKADGIFLWELLIARFKPATKDEIELEDLRAAFTAFSRNKNEREDNYIQRF